MRKAFIRSTIAAIGTALAVAAGPVAFAPAAQASDVACQGYASSSSSCTNTQRTINGTSYSTDWYVPHGTATALMVLNHGFSRDCATLRGTSRAIAEKGVMVLCVNGDMTAGNPALARDVAAALAGRTLAPVRGRAVPERIIVGGHSAGGHFAGVVGAALATSAPGRLAGAILFDPVAAEGFSADLKAISANGSRPVLSVAARPSVTNLFNNSFGALNDLANPYVGIQLVWKSYVLGFPTGGSCHTDVEGEDTDVIGTIGALCSPHATQTARLREFGSAWAKDLATGTRTSAYWCTDAQQVSTCGSKVKELVDRTLPLATPIR